MYLCFDHLIIPIINKFNSLIPFFYFENEIEKLNFDITYFVQFTTSICFFPILFIYEHNGSF
jgi:hypothetical protein